MNLKSVFKKILLILLSCSMITPALSMNPPRQNPPISLPKSVDPKQAMRLKNNKLEDYFSNEKKGSSDFDSDFKIFAKNAEILGIFSDNADFLAWWKKIKQSYSPQIT